MNSLHKNDRPFFENSTYRYTDNKVLGSFPSAVTVRFSSRIPVVTLTIRAMFSHKFICGSLTKMTETGITFDPPVYEQRYCATIQILEDARWKDQIKKVVEFGCAEMRFFQLMRRIETIEHIGLVRA